jgi:hypothetical protein
MDEEAGAAPGLWPLLSQLGRRRGVALTGVHSVFGGDRLARPAGMIEIVLERLCSSGGPAVFGSFSNDPYACASGQW